MKDKPQWGCIGAVLVALIAVLAPVILSYVRTATIRNELLLPVSVYIDDIDQGILLAQSSDKFFFDSIPARVRIELVRNTSGSGEPFGEMIVGEYNRLKINDVIVVANVVGDNYYFFPRITNNTEYKCEISINDGLQIEKRIGVLPANTARVVMGYYKLYAESNITLYCENQTYWWGIREGDGVPLYPFVAPNSGLLEIALNPAQSSTSIILPTTSPASISVEKAITDYYFLIQQQQYEQAYCMLSDRFKSNKVPTLDVYRAEWEKSGPVSIDGPIEVVENGDSATAAFTLYFYRSDKQVYYTVRYHLTRSEDCSNPRFGCWQIQSGEIIPKSP